MKEEVKTPVLIAVVVVIVLLVAYFGFKQLGNAGNLDQGQIKYTPGVPPWMEKDPAKRGPGSSSPSGQPYAVPPPGGGPPGMSAPAPGNNG